MTKPRYINTGGVPLSLAVFLATDHYDHDDTTISATSLIKPLRQLILGGRIKEGQGLPDLPSMMASRVGTAIHTGIEQSWQENHVEAMKALGYPDKVIARVRINPSEADLLADPDIIPVYMELRSYKQVGQYKVAGKFDFVGQGQLEDFKTTGTYSYMTGSNNQKYIMQGSLYKWLNPTIITENTIAIRFIFTDWSSMSARQSTSYPQQRFASLVLPLWTVEETDRYVHQKLADFDRFVDAPEDQLPLCTDEELGRTEPQYKWYKNGDASASRSTKNFDDAGEARAHMMTVGKGAGIIVMKPGLVTACKFCPGLMLCSQKDALIEAGDLVFK